VAPCYSRINQLLVVRRGHWANLQLGRISLVMRKKLGGTDTGLRGDFTAPAVPTCRACGAKLTRTVLDLGKSPLANSFLTASDLNRPESFYPLRLLVCDACRLVQLAEFESAQAIFSDYLYFSSYSQTWLDHCRDYASAIIPRCALNTSSQVVEIASNDGHLLQLFQKAGISVLGVEPAANVAAAALAKGIPTEVAFFGVETARRLAAAGKSADLLVANNVLAHVPRLHDFVEGCAILLKPGGVATFEFPHLLNLIMERQFDTIYHEHFSYFSLAVVEWIFAEHGLAVFDVEQLSTHGGSLRVYAAHMAAKSPRSARCEVTLQAERSSGLDRHQCYDEFARAVIDIKCALLNFLCKARSAGKSVAGYGAPAKGNTLLNFCGVGPELLPYIVDRSTHKQGRYLPGVQIPIHAPERIIEAKPDYVLILPWNIKDEIVAQMACVRDWGGHFVTAIPQLRVF
jgi:SAM-dependent methyltransferase